MTDPSFNGYKMLIIMLTLVGQMVLSQEDSTATSTIFTVSSGSQALQFHLTGQVAASYKYHLSKESALRFTADISGLIREDKEDYTDRHQLTKRRDKKDNSQKIKIVPGYVYHFNAANRVKLFVGVGPFVGFSSSRYSYAETNPDRSFSFEETTISWQYGVSANGGLECHITEYLSILSEYELAASYAPTNVDKELRDDYIYPSSYMNSQRIRTWKVELSSLRVGIGVYL